MAASNKLVNSLNIALGGIAGREAAAMLNAADAAMADNETLTLGTDNDSVLYHKSAANNANTTITGVFVGTPVTAALAANSLIMSNITASGDFMLALNRGGNSENYIFADSSAGDLSLYAPAGEIILTPTTDVQIANGTGLTVGHTAQVTISNGDGSTNLIPEVQILGTAKADASLLLAAFNTTNDATVAPSLNFLKSGNAAIGSNTIVATGEVLGEITWFVDDGVDYEAPAAQISAIALATQGAGDSPGAILFKATTDAGEALAEVGRMNVAAGLTLGLAGTSLGKLTLSGNTAGVITINTAATAGDWTLTLPPDNGDAGEQLETDGNGVTTWTAAGSMRQVKDIIETLNDKAGEALDRILGAPVYAFRYKKDARLIEKLPALSDTETVFHGIVAQEYPEVMMRDGKIFNPISAFGESSLAIKALHGLLQEAFAQIKALSGELAALKGA